MTVSLFNDQLILEVPENIQYICFKRMPIIIDFCLQFPLHREYILIDKDTDYVTLNAFNDNQWWSTDGDLNVIEDHYDATDALLQLIPQEPETYEYW